MANRWQVYKLLGMSWLLLDGLVLSPLALTDIAHSVEPDQGAEWSIVGITFRLAGLLIYSNVLLARRTLHKRGRIATGSTVDPSGIGLHRSGDI